MRIGYFLSSEEHGPGDLVRQAQLAEDHGLSGLWISDHYHPWNNTQSHPDLGYDELFIQQVGPNQEEFFTFFAKEVEPLLAA